MAELLVYESDGTIATITMDDGKVNALSPAMFSALDAAFDRAESEHAAVLLTGRAGVFSGGFDLKILRAGGKDALDMMITGFRLSARMLAFPRPVVIACSGHAIAMGVFLCLSGDYRVGTRGEFKIVANEVAIGLTMPRFGVEVCRQRLAPSCFTRAVAGAEQFTPDDAVAAGFLDRVVEPSSLVEVARAEAARLAALPPEAHAASKMRARERSLRAINDAIDADERELFALLG